MVELVLELELQQGRELVQEAEQSRLGHAMALLLVALMVPALEFEVFDDSLRVVQARGNRLLLCGFL